MRFPYPLILLVLLMAAAGCSPTQDGAVSGVYHNLTAHYNGYFYAQENIRSVENTILKSLDDDHNLLLKLYPRIDTTLANSYEKETEEAIKMASISIQRHPNSRWLYQNYILVGLARLYNGDFQEAIQTFKYVNTKSNQADVRHEALIHLIRTFTEQSEYEKAEETIDFLNKEKLSRLNAKRLYLEKANMYQIRQDYDRMVRNLTAADTLLTRSDRRARIYFIIGQVYQKIGFGAEAFNYYKKCLGTNPDYEIDFYARLNMAQVTQTNDASNVKAIRKQLSRMLADEKNKEFRDKIFYEIGEFELRQGNLKTAMNNYRSCLRAGNSTRIKGLGYLRLGQIYYDSSKKFALAQAYYDSAVAALPEDTEGLEAIKFRQSILGEFVEYTSTIALQDSLLALAQMDTALLRRRMDSVQLVTEKAEAAKKAKKKAKNASSGPDSGPGGTFRPTETTTTGDWYFGNNSAVALGQSEFQRIWGTVKLEDNWRRSVKTTLTPGEVAVTPGMETSKTAEAAPAQENAKPESLFQKLYAQLPLTDEQKQEAGKKLEEAYYKLGDLYFFRLAEKPNAISSYLTLLHRFPETKQRPEVLYKLYLATKDTDKAESGKWKKMLIAEFPSNTLARLVVNPNYLAEENQTTERQKALYREAYENLRSGQIQTASSQIDESLSLGETEFSPQLRLLKIMVTGKTEDITRYQFELGEFIKKFPDHPTTSYAETLLQASKDFQEKAERAAGIRYKQTLDQPHNVVLVHRRNDNLTESLTKVLDDYHQKNPSAAPKMATNLVLDETLTLTFIPDFPDAGQAKTYLQQIRGQILDKDPFINHKFDSFVISRDNFGTFYRTRALAEYLAFYERNYPQ